ncbi:protein kinase-like protein [Nitrospirillum amazonense]|uniref:Protein kinase-like protein n=1 Tax=Nitrospirillum amazonense TaxID=28077 RepID=A0A560FK62_9PROT|nr:protein kinase [Nitrospirillum amazonense]TWB21985.1 protein kinase-like protein [Nitrospirillum amazonense]
MSLRSVRPLGYGGFGNVDLVVDKFGMYFARKTFNVNQPLDVGLADNVRQRFKREVKIQKQFNHRNIVPILGDGLDVDPPYYLMPVAESKLSNDLEFDRKLGGNFIVAVMEIIAGLEEMHRLSIYHRDLKPDNVLRFLNQNGVDGWESYYAISDFGLISVKDSTVSRLSTTGMARGSDFYTAPEVCVDLRNSTAQSDIFSLGCILHDMVGLRDRRPLFPIDEHGHFGGLLLGCTREEPERRFKTVAAVREALLALDLSSAQLTDPVAETIAGYLECAGGMRDEQVRALIDILDRKKGSSDAEAIMMRMKQDNIVEICSNFPERGRRLGLLYAEWVKSTSFGFERCDEIAVRLQTFMECCPLDVQADCLLAMLELGTSHNRWYVERKFMSLCGPSMKGELAGRLAMEFRILGAEICGAIRHIEWSINANRAVLHPLLVAALKDVCS